MNKGPIYEEGSYMWHYMYEKESYIHVSRPHCDSCLASSASSVCRHAYSVCGSCNTCSVWAEEEECNIHVSRVPSACCHTYSVSSSCHTVLQCVAVCCSVLFCNSCHTYSVCGSSQTNMGCCGMGLGCWSLGACFKAYFYTIQFKSFSAAPESIYVS